MKADLINSADVIGIFCRLHMNSKRDLPIRPSEMGMLIYAQKQSCAVTPLMISQFFNISKPSVSSMVKSLTKQGFLIKESSIADKRSYTLVITEKGKNLVESTFIEYFKAVELLKEKMGAEKFDQLVELMEIVNCILEKENR
ncbi:MarR family winged helix-turn-helix transcriptional regulator [Acetobacterium sp.]|uniref:MarR family winged helix-turn-helix transcriptional regulator n=1 Tax=Acetobacterium sp. TaxID=1872094 RepID=UPI0035937248